MLVPIHIKCRCNAHSVAILADPGRPVLELWNGVTQVPVPMLRSSPTPEGRCWHVADCLALIVQLVAILADPGRPVLE